MRVVLLVLHNAAHMKRFFYMRVVLLVLHNVHDNIK